MTVRQFAGGPRALPSTTSRISWAWTVSGFLTVLIRESRSRHGCLLVE
jgi:hypothetical protein